jgi:hypothetical protein
MRICFAVLFSLCMVFSCEKNDQDTLVDMNCILMADINGAPLGIYGGCAPQTQWQDQDLSQEELGFLGRAGEVLTYGNAGLVDRIVAFPNPTIVGGEINLAIQTTESSNYRLNLAIVDSQKTVLSSQSIDFFSNTNIRISLPAGTFQEGSFYRVYYQIADNQEAIVAEGYGNFLVCASFPITDIDSDCF